MIDKNIETNEIGQLSELSEEDLENVAGGTAPESGLSGSMSSYLVKKGSPRIIGHESGPIKSN